MWRVVSVFAGLVWALSLVAAGHVTQVHSLDDDSLSCPLLEPDHIPNLPLYVGLQPLQKGWRFEFNNEADKIKTFKFFLGESEGKISGNMTTGKYGEAVGKFSWPGDSFPQGEWRYFLIDREDKNYVRVYYTQLFNGGKLPHHQVWKQGLTGKQSFVNLKETNLHFNCMRGCRIEVKRGSFEILSDIEYYLLAVEPPCEICSKDHPDNCSSLLDVTWKKFPGQEYKFPNNSSVLTLNSTILVSEECDPQPPVITQVSTMMTSTGEAEAVAATTTTTNHQVTAGTTNLLPDSTSVYLQDNNNTRTSPGNTERTFLSPETTSLASTIHEDNLVTTYEIPFTSDLDVETSTDVSDIEDFVLVYSTVEEVGTEVSTDENSSTEERVTRLPFPRSTTRSNSKNLQQGEEKNRVSWKSIVFPIVIIMAMVAIITYISIFKRLRQRNNYTCIVPSSGESVELGKT
ncbi:hypothetical protein Hamer_G003803 [Homarus americanus]|uniref:Uncharacterized protein n=1 Tax=Homarus americanus TaxID=6706 RepID=A0A8J5TNC7_HOMAM|nr:hypothetical protein Hamer_G003803 [Homarus americanus]